MKKKGYANVFFFGGGGGANKGYYGKCASGDEEGPGGISNTYQITSNITCGRGGTCASDGTRNVNRTHPVNLNLISLGTVS